MCTSIAINLNEKFLFGRNMDLEYDFGSGVCIMPRNFPLRLRCGEVSLRHNALVGCAAVKDGYPLFSDAANEAGLCVAALRFPDSSGYSRTKREGLTPLAPFEIIPYVLAKCASANEARALLSRCNIMDIPFDDDLPNSPLHFHFADAKESFVLELYGGQTNIADNPVGVLTNGPDFSFHLSNLALYLNLGRGVPRESEGAHIFGGGLMAHGLPGDYSSPSRFVKCAWLRRCAECERGGEVRAVMDILGAVAPPSGSVLTEDGERHYTRYTAVMDASCGAYTILRAGALCPDTVRMEKESLDDDSLHTVFF